MDSSCRVLAALGRPLYPGMLYDCRTDTFIPGVTLWDKKALHDDLDVRQQPKTDLKFAASDSLSDKANLLDISASLKASFLCGLVEVGGSAKYLNDTKSSAHQCRVTMQYSQTTKFEQLTMKELGNITYQQVFEQKTATHVVTAVLYGASAFMVFDYTRADNQSIQDIEGNLNAVVKMLPLISVEGQGSLKMTEAEKNLAENISVTFYGDYKLNKNPTTYKEALDVYITLPSVMEKGNYDGVPLTVWLYPLNLLDESAAKLVREINMRLLCKTEKLLAELGEVERRCNDLKKNQMTNSFPGVKDRLVKFQQSHNNYKIAFQKALSKVLPAVRGDKRMKFIIGSISDSSNPGTSIRLYQKGRLIDPKFQPVSKPPQPVLESSDEKIILKLSKSPTGETIRFRVEYSMTPTDSSANVEWKFTDTSDDQTSFTLTQIKEAGHYRVLYRAINNVGLSEISDSITFTFQNKADEEKLNPGIIRSKIFFMHSDDPQPVSSTRKSYLGSVPGGLRPGMALFFQGVVTSDCDWFAIDMQTRLDSLVELAFHFRCRMESMCLTSLRNETWDNEECLACPFTKGGAFDVIMVIKPECYEVIVNGLEYCTFNHRMPVEQVTVLNIYGGVFMNIVHIIK
ncbi:neoverrucotoxin subunit beta-like, partial [Clarias magur]